MLNINVVKVYCVQCERTYEIEKNSEIRPESIIGIILLFIFGIGFLSFYKAKCPYCDGRLKKYKGQKLNPKTFRWAEPGEKFIMK